MVPNITGREDQIKPNVTILGISDVIKQEIRVLIGSKDSEINFSCSEKHEEQPLLVC